MRSILLGLLLSQPVLAHADGGFIVAEAPAALVVSDAQDGVFRPGVAPALGAYLDAPIIALGVRLRAGVLANGHEPGEHLADPGAGGLVTASLAARLRHRAAWFELAAGGGLTGSDLVPAIEVGVGITTPFHGVDIGPSIRYVRVISRDEMDAFGTAELALVGLDVRFGGRARPLRPTIREAVAVAPAAPPPAVVAPAPRDPDRVVETLASCAEELDGCRLTAGVVVKTDRIILEEKVFFEFDRARVRSAGRAALAEVAALWAQHPEWKSLSIEGHTDVRGSDDYNVRLSQLRAERVRDLLVKLGSDPARLSTVGHGRSQPIVEAHDEDAHRKNRRVELVIQRELAEDARIIIGGQP